MTAFQGSWFQQPPPAAELVRSATEGLAMDEPASTCSVSFRLQRTTTEFAFVSVPVTADLIVEQPDGTGRIDVAKMVQRAVSLGQAADVAWHPEGQEVQPHPIQVPPPGLAGGAQDAEPDRRGHVVVS